MKKAFNILSFFFIILTQVAGQVPTIGLLEYDRDLISEGYTLFCPWISSDCYLINNCGEKINTWRTELPFDLTMAYLDDEGHLLILNKDILVKFDWEGQKIWEFKSEEYGIEAHHDFELMPDGNLLLIAKEPLSAEQETELGFDTYNDENFPFQVDGLYEFKHIEDDSFELVWKWSFKDHLVQENIDSISNFGLVHQSPRKLDLNYTVFPDAKDWLHCNGVNYNETLDQVILSSRNTSEIYIIDHSTTIEEAASSSGGNQGFGGDFLWRWGNQNLVQQHDPNWIPSGHPNEGMISVFNNIDSSALTLFSSIKIIDPPVDAQGKYILDTLNQFLPKEPIEILSGEEHEIFSPFMSGAHSQENGNFIICSGRFGDFYELTRDGRLAWKYHNPIFEIPLIQYSEPMASFTFNIKKYPLDFIGFDGKDLSSKGLIENENLVSTACTLTDTEDISTLDLRLFPNPSQGKLFLETESKVKQVQVFALSGKKILQLNNPSDVIEISLEAGSYIFQFQTENQFVNKLIVIAP